MFRRFAALGFLGFAITIVAQPVAGCSTAQCDTCDKAGKYQHCTDCPTTDECTVTITEEKSGKTIFTCTEKVGESCATSALLQYCDE